MNIEDAHRDVLQTVMARDAPLRSLTWQDQARYWMEAEIVEV